MVFVVDHFPEEICYYDMLKIYIKEVKLPSVGLERAINTATKIMTVKVVPIPILIRPIRMVRNKNRKMMRKKD